MKNYINVSIKISGLVFVSALLFFIVSLFWYQDYSSIREFLNDFFVGKNVILLFLIFIFSLIIGFILGMFIKKIFKDIEEYNKKLQDYNHYLAHELKTPISVVNSNLDVLKYGFDESKIESSKKELKNMINIIDGLLSFSETIQITNKTDINLENFIKKNLYFIDGSEHIQIINNEFNFSIYTDELLFERVIKNLIENALKYSLDKKVKISIFGNKLTFENNIYKTLEQEDIDKIFTKFYSGSFNQENGNGIGIPMIYEITKALGYELQIKSKDYKFIAEIIF